MQIQPHYAAIDAMIERVRRRFEGEDDYIAEVFASCLQNTLQTTIHFGDDGRIFVATGDIPAMWLRDSTAQLVPFLRFAAEEPDIREILLRLNRAQWEMEQSAQYDYIVVNDQVETCAEEILKIIAEKAD